MYSMTEENRITSGAYRKIERKKTQHANYVAAHQGQTAPMVVSGVLNYPLEGYSARPSQTPDEQENASLTYSISSTGESTDSSFAGSILGMNEIYDLANLQLSAAAQEMLVKSKSGTLPSGRSFTRDSSFASDSLGYSTDGDSYCGYADYSNVAMSRTGYDLLLITCFHFSICHIHIVLLLSPHFLYRQVAYNNALDHKQLITEPSVSNQVLAPIRGRTNDPIVATPAIDKLQRQTTNESQRTRTPSNTSTRTPPNPFPIMSRNVSSSSPATVVTSDVSLSSTGTPPPPRRKADRDIRNSNTRTKMRDDYDDSRPIPAEIRGPGSANLSYARWWMCGFTDAFNFNG